MDALRSEAAPASLRRPTWQGATVSEVLRETATATTLRLDVPDWPGHRAGQHVDVRLTAPDGYTAVRPYSLASPAGAGVEITVETTPGGEVSPYLARGAEVGHHVDVRGPLGTWFLWDIGDLGPVQLIAGGSGLVPLMSMLRTHAGAGHAAPMRLLYSLADPSRLLYRDGVTRLQAAGAATVLYTRAAPAAATRPPGRMTPAELSDHTLPPTAAPSCFVCGPTGFVESVIERLVLVDHEPGRIRAERYGDSAS